MTRPAPLTLVLVTSVALGLTLAVPAIAQALRRMEVRIDGRGTSYPAVEVGGEQYVSVRAIRNMGIGVRANRTTIFLETDRSRNEPARDPGDRGGRGGGVSVGEPGGRGDISIGLPGGRDLPIFSIGGGGRDGEWVDLERSQVRVTLDKNQAWGDNGRRLGYIVEFGSLPAAAPPATEVFAEMPRLNLGGRWVRAIRAPQPVTPDPRNGSWRFYLDFEVRDGWNARGSSEVWIAIKRGALTPRARELRFRVN